MSNLNKEKFIKFLDESLLFKKLEVNFNDEYINLKTGKHYIMDDESLSIVIPKELKEDYRPKHFYVHSYDKKLYIYLQYEERKYLNELKELGLDIDENLDNEKKSSPKI